MPGHILTIRRSGAFAARAAVAVLALAVLAAAPASARARQAPGVAGWQRTDLRPVTQPAPAGGLFVLYAAGADRSLQLIAVDPGTGRTAWSRPASPSEVTPGEAPSLTVVGDTVIYLGRGFATNAAVTAVDARTGAIVWQTAEGDFTTWPGLCLGNDAVICVSTAVGAPHSATRTSAPSGSGSWMAGRSGAPVASLRAARSPARATARRATTLPGPRPGERWPSASSRRAA